MSNQQPSFQEMFRVFGKIGLLSFGGPAAQISLMHRELVEEKTWLTEQQYLGALSFCMLLPGPEAMQLATYAGWRLKGALGGLLAGLLFVIPGAFVILALASIYAYYGDVSLVSTLFLGVKAAVLIIVIEALLKVSKRALKLVSHWVIAALAFVAIFFFAVPFPLIILIAAFYGFVFSSKNRDQIVEVPEISFGKTAMKVILGVNIWLIPLYVIDSFFGTSILYDIGGFFSKLAVVTFGGAYAVLAYMTQDVVSQFGWLTTGEMMDGLGLAETTPGPLILVTEFVGFLAAFREGGFWLGVAGALLTLWVTFVPCFIWIFAGAPYIEWITAQPKLNGALTAITAAVVGVILNLSLWFGLHVLFDEVKKLQLGAMKLWMPTLDSLNWQVALLSLVCAFALLRLRLGIVKVLVSSAGLAWLLSYV